MPYAYILKAFLIPRQQPLTPHTRMLRNQTCRVEQKDISIRKKAVRKAVRALLSLAVHSFSLFHQGT